jgi:hypothetical protein
MHAAHDLLILQAVGPFGNVGDLPYLLIRGSLAANYAGRQMRRKR